jgi:surfeit locus 1 family protein
MLSARTSRWLVLTAAVVTAAATARLGVWQLDRARQKSDLQASLSTRLALPALSTQALARDARAAADQHHRQIVLEGHWQARWTIYLDNRQMNARPGFFAVTPLLLDDGSAVLVQRGWWPRDQADRTRVAAPAAPEGRVQLRGRVGPWPSALFEFTAARESGPIRQNLDLNDFARETGLMLRPLSVLQLEEAVQPGAAVSMPADGLLRQWLMPAANVEKHHGYAAQWFALSALSIGLYAWFQIIRPRRAERAKRAKRPPSA